MYEDDSSAPKLELIADLLEGISQAIRVGGQIFEVLDKLFEDEEG